eukprot:gnl/TRDRNA2_/TRDRNA2_94181_c1_seq1.p1 gnl/TRDRNA2_/TRDRNA2_94181_c1~~gnl/TRDRNA2_/TRDRNA2_94181_c1_seq1.p1  ORF type:complete len:566 (+),score=121.76 gnl/TRDRNA2_/TRDRNA2_94181_c1_seq1:3-1700(+)
MELQLLKRELQARAASRGRSGSPIRPESQGVQGPPDAKLAQIEQKVAGLSASFAALADEMRATSRRVGTASSAGSAGAIAGAHGSSGPSSAGVGHGGTGPGGAGGAGGPVGGAHGETGQGGWGFDNDFSARIADLESKVESLSSGLRLRETGAALDGVPESKMDQVLAAVKEVAVSQVNELGNEVQVQLQAFQQELKIVSQGKPASRGLPSSDLAGPMDAEGILAKAVDAAKQIALEVAGSGGGDGAGIKETIQSACAEATAHHENRIRALEMQSTVQAKPSSPTGDAAAAVRQIKARAEELEGQLSEEVPSGGSSELGAIMGRLAHLEGRLESMGTEIRQVTSASASMKKAADLVNEHETRRIPALESALKEMKESGESGKAELIAELDKRSEARMEAAWRELTGHAQAAAMRAEVLERNLVQRIEKTESTLVSILAELEASKQDDLREEFRRLAQQVTSMLEWLKWRISWLEWATNGEKRSFGRPQVGDRLSGSPGPAPPHTATATAFGQPLSEDIELWAREPGGKTRLRRKPIKLGIMDGTTKPDLPADTVVKSSSLPALKA